MNIVYDGDGNRVSETAGGITSTYLVDTLNPTGYAQVIDELVNGAVVRTYAIGLQRISQNQIINGLFTPSFYGYDGHGNVRFLENSNGVITDTYDFDTFGNLIARTGTTPNNYLFSGEQFDSATSLYQMRARWYRQVTGRFITRDPLDGICCMPLTFNPYIYAYDDPVNKSDPSGRGLLEYVTLIVREVLPVIVYAARLVCYTYAATILVTELISLATTGHFFAPPPYWVFGLPCALFGLPFPPKPPNIP